MTIPSVPAKVLKRALALVAQGISPTEASRQLAELGMKVSKTTIYEALERQRERKAKNSPDVVEPQPPPPTPEEAPLPTNDAADDVRRIDAELERASKLATLAAGKGDLVRYGPLAKLVADLVAKRARVRPPPPPDPEAERRKHEQLAREVIGMLEQYMPDHERIDPESVKVA